MEARRKPWEGRNPGEYVERAGYMARLLAARSAGSPAAVLSGDALALLQEDPVLQLFWRGEPNGEFFAIDPEELRNPDNQEDPATCASFDLHVGYEMLLIEPSVRHVRFEGNKKETIPPGSLVIVKSWEYVCMPPFLAGLLVSPVAVAMNGASNISTMIDPVFDGFLILNFTNLSPWSIEITPRRLVSRIVFHMVAHVDNPRLGGRYRRTHREQEDLQDIIKGRIGRIEEDEKPGREKAKEKSPIYSAGLIGALKETVWKDRTS
jgi:deoxycytidine triphosphate deaminase